MFYQRRTHGPQTYVRRPWLVVLVNLGYSFYVNAWLLLCVALSHHYEKPGCSFQMVGCYLALFNVLIYRCSWHDQPRPTRISSGAVGIAMCFTVIFWKKYNRTLSAWLKGQKLFSSRVRRNVQNLLCFPNLSLIITQSPMLNFPYYCVQMNKRGNMRLLPLKSDFSNLELFCGYIESTTNLLKWYMVILKFMVTIEQSVYRYIWKYGLINWL